MTRLEELASLSRRLGDPSADLAILAEGNTSCRDGNRFWVKSSGRSLCGIDGQGFVMCDPEVLVSAFGRELSDLQIKDVLERSCLRGANGGTNPAVRPSVEAFMHAWLLTLSGVEFVGHVHPTSVLALVCSPSAQQLCRMRFFPDEVVCCGPATAWVPYVDPGLPLAEKVKESVSNFVREHGEAPKVLWLQNHGVIAVGRSAAEVESALLMNDKAARVILAAGGIQAVEKDRIVPLSPQVVERIRTRPDEHYRQDLLWSTGGPD